MSILTGLLSPQHPYIVQLNQLIYSQQTQTILVYPFQLPNQQVPIPHFSELRITHLFHFNASCRCNSTSVMQIMTTHIAF